MLDGGSGAQEIRKGLIESTLRPQKVDTNNYCSRLCCHVMHSIDIGAGGPTPQNPSNMCGPVNLDQHQQVSELYQAFD